MREASITRNTTETQITLRLELDGSGKGQIGTGCGFLDHMLTLFTRHGRFDMILSAAGDTHVDDHHLTEDVGIVLGQAFRKALGDKPVVFEADIGHVHPTFTLINGSYATLSCKDGKGWLKMELK